MKTVNRVKGTIRFAFKSNKKAETNKSKSFTIYLFFTYGVGKKIKISTGLKAKYGDWDFKKQCFKNKSTVEDYDKKNQTLKTLGANINEAYNNLIDEGIDFSQGLLRAKYDKTNNNQTTKITKERLVFVDVTNKFLDYKKGTISEVTLRSYNQALRLIEKFQKHHNTTLECEDIDPDFHKSFVSYLEEVEDFKLNTIGKHIKTIKTFMNYALNEGYTTNQRFKSSEFKVMKESTTQIYLDEDEIKAMYEYDFNKYHELEHARDLFLMGYYTGQRVSDYNSYKKEDIVKQDEVNFFKIVQKKNRKKGRIVLCPITKEMQNIMDSRHDGLPPKKIHDKDLNLLIKQVGQHIEVDSLNELIKCTYTQGGKEIIEYEKKYNLIGTHTARRSFATNMYKKGMPVYDIMLFTGHTTEKEFYKYLRIKDEERASHVVKAGYFNV
ncbi:tyrosine-type recombinase/integrase [Psychroflexus sp. MBR-150]|jgi:site-specific recombinase XerD